MVLNFAHECITRKNEVESNFDEAEKKDEFERKWNQIYTWQQQLSVEMSREGKRFW